jgi:hypothetical protein
VMTLIVVIFIAASFETAAGFACRVGARFQSLVGVKVERGRAPENGDAQIAGSDAHSRAPASVFAPPGVYFGRRLKSRACRQARRVCNCRK